MRLSIGMRSPSTVSQTDRARPAPRRCAATGGGVVRLRPVDHGRGRARLGHGRARPACLAALHHPRRDPEHAEAEVVVGAEDDVRRREHHVALAARVLGQVLLQLELERVLVGLELAAVVRREVDRVLVRDVDPRDGDGAVVVHLLDELARELDRLDVRPEGTAEHALDERFDLVLDRAENAQCRPLGPFEFSRGPRLPGRVAAPATVAVVSSTGCAGRRHARPRSRSGSSASASAVAAVDGEDGDVRRRAAAATTVDPADDERIARPRRAARGRARAAGRPRRARAAAASGDQPRIAGELGGDRRPAVTRRPWPATPSAPMRPRPRPRPRRGRRAAHAAAARRRGPADGEAEHRQQAERADRRRAAAPSASEQAGARRRARARAADDRRDAHRRAASPSE